MQLTRRRLAQQAAMAAAATLLADKTLRADEAAHTTAELEPSLQLPDRSQFVASKYQVSLNNARWHPMSKGALNAVQEYLAYKQRGIWQPPDLSSAIQQQVRNEFAALIHAQSDDIAYVNSTTAGETMFVSALGFSKLEGNIVTDALHFEGSLYMYDALARQGVDVRVAKVRDWRIHLEDLAKLIDAKTRLVAISQVSFINGFEHDLKAVCELAHAHGALVYVDAVQAAGCIPIDVQKCGVDALGCASYKWLMGDMGIGFLYVSAHAREQLHRTLYGYRQLEEFSYHAFPWDKPGHFPVDWKQASTTAGFFEIGTYANPVIAALSFSLPWLRKVGIEKIQAHTQSMNQRLRAELPRLGYSCITPEDSHAPVTAYLVREMETTQAALRRNKVDVSLSEGRMRISPSVYNSMEDVEKLLAALG